MSEWICYGDKGLSINGEQQVPQRVRDNQKRDEMRSEIIKIAAALARFQHCYTDELEQDDLPQFGDFANRLKKIADLL